MKFRYKVDKVSKSDRYYIKIQKRNQSRFLPWEEVAYEELRTILWSLNDNIDYFAFHGVPASALYDELSKYSSMAEVVMEYIHQEILKDDKIQVHEALCENLIDKFVLTNGWKTIEVEENKE